MWIDHFLVLSYLNGKQVIMQYIFYKNVFPLHVHFHANQTHFFDKTSAQELV